MERREDRSAVQQDQLEVGGRSSHEKDVLGIRGVLPRKASHDLRQPPLHHPRRPLEGTERHLSQGGGRRPLPRLGRRTGSARTRRGGRATGSQLMERSRVTIPSGGTWTAPEMGRNPTCTTRTLQGPGWRSGTEYRPSESAMTVRRRDPEDTVTMALARGSDPCWPRILPGLPRWPGLARGEVGRYPLQGGGGSSRMRVQTRVRGS